jgi:phosphate transport system substrate-binding protein
MGVLSWLSAAAAQHRLLPLLRRRLSALARLLPLSLAIGLGACNGRVPLVPTPTEAPPPAAVVPITVACPESLVPATLAVASAFQRQIPEVEVTIVSLADTLALRALRQGDADVAVVTWLPEALPEGAWARPVSRDGMAIVVNPQNGVSGLTMTQLQELFQGRLEDWATWSGFLGPFQLVSRETASGASAFFQAWVMRDARVSLNALMAPSSEAVLQFVAEDSLAVGYVSTAWVDGSVRALVINAVPPTTETIAAGLYPLSRTNFVVTLTEPEGATREFVQWLLAEPGQAVLEAHGFVRAPE